MHSGNANAVVDFSCVERLAQLSLKINPHAACTDKQVWTLATHDTACTYRKMQHIYILPQLSSLVICHRCVATLQCYLTNDKQMSMRVLTW